MREINFLIEQIQNIFQKIATKKLAVLYRILAIVLKNYVPELAPTLTYPYEIYKNTIWT